MSSGLFLAASPNARRNRDKEKARSKSGLLFSGGVQFTTELLAIGVNEHWRMLLRKIFTVNSDPPPPRILLKPQVTSILRKMCCGLHDLVQALTQLPGSPLLVGNHYIQQ